MSKTLQDMTEEEILEYIVALTEEDYDKLDEESKEIVDRVISENSDDEGDEGAVEAEADAEVEAKEGEAELEEAAADTLKPGGAPGDSKSQMLDTMVALMAQLGKEDLSNLFTRTLEQIGTEASALPGNANADANRATIATKGAVKEDINEMFSGDELSEELKERASVVFEAAVNTRAALTEAKLTEAFEAKTIELEAEFEKNLEEASEAMFAEVSTKLDQYLDYTVNEWMEANQLAIDNGLRAEIAEDFIKGLHGLFSEHYIKVPEDSLDIVAELKSQVDDLNDRLNETLDRNIELEAIINEDSAKSILDTVSEGLAETDVERLKTLSEGIEYTDAETFEKKLKIIKENYFNKPTKVDTGLIVESIDGDVEAVNETVEISTEMAAYIKALKPKI